MFGKRSSCLNTVALTIPSNHCFYKSKVILYKKYFVLFVDGIESLRISFYYGIFLAAATLLYHAGVKWSQRS